MKLKAVQVGHTLVLQASLMHLVNSIGIFKNKLS